MRQVLTVLVVIAALWGGIRFLNFAKTEVATNERSDRAPRYAAGKLPGLPAELEDSLGAAQREGAGAFRRWMAQNRSQIAEPRLTELELDFVVLTGRTDSTEARGVLNLIKRRIKPDHVQYKRFQQLDAAYR